MVDVLRQKKLPIASAYLPSSYAPSAFNHFVELEDGSRLAYNAMSSAMAKMDAESWARYQALVGGARVDRDNAVDQKLLEGKYLVPTGFDEVAHLRTRHLESRYDPSSWGLTICPTIACNFGCDYCFEVHKPGKMGQEVQDALVRLLEQRTGRIRSFSVTWYGGEPTLAWDVVQALSKRFIAICDAHGIDYDAGIVTNGYLLDEAKVAELPAMRIDHVQITLDGDAAHHDARRKLLSGKGTFERIVENLAHFLGTTTPVSIRVNVDGRNKDGVHALIDRLAGAGLAGRSNISIYFAPVDAATEPSHGIAQFCMTRKDFAMAEPEYYEHAVRAGLAAVPYPRRGSGTCIAVRPEGYVVQSDGELHKCWDTVGQSQFAVGHLLDPHHNPLESPEYQRWMAWEPFKEDVACSRCTWLASCMGGCPLKVVHPELSPDGQVHLECTTFKFNAAAMLPMFAAWAAGGAPKSNQGCDG